MKQDSDNIYEVLDLPLTAKWTEVKQTYDAAMNGTGHMKKEADAEQIREIKKKQSHLKNLFAGFSKKVSAENARMFQTKQALQSVGLPESADWDTVQKRSGNSRSADWETLHQNRDLLLRNPKRKNHTILTAAAALAGAGVSLAAYHYLAGSHMDNSDRSSGTADTAARLPEEHIQQLPDPLINQEDIDAYVSENSHVDAEMMSLLGLAPSPELKLTIDFKMQVLNALVKTI
jgi:hypothetical protein